MNRLYFIEQLDPAANYSDGKIVSLAPAVSYALEKKGISFEVVRRNEEDKAIRGNDDAFFLKQIEWVKGLDRFLQNEVPALRENSIRAAYHHFSKLKFVMDTILVYALETENFLKKHKTDSLVYVGAGESDFSSPSIFDLRKNGHQAYLEVLKLICRERNIRFEIQAVQSHAPAPAAPKSFLEQAKPLLKVLGVKQWYNFFKYAKWKNNAAADTSSKEGVLFLDAGSEKIDHVLKAFVSKGMRIFTMVGREIFEYSSMKETRVASLDETTIMVSGLSDAADKITANSSLYTIMREKTGLDLSSILKPYLANFIEKIIPGVVSDYAALQSFCASHRIQTMVAHGSSGKQYTAALNLAKNSGTIKSVCFQHSCGPTYWLDWVYGELDYFHYFMSTDSLHESFFQKMAKEPWMDRCDVRQSPFYLKKLKAESALQKDSKTVLYIPRKQSMRISKFNSYLYPLPWLYEIQKAILDMFGRHPEIPVIYKHHPSSKWAEASILRYLEEKNYRNISVQQGSLKNFFEKAGRVFMDYPSTPLFEAAASGLPVLALYPSADRIIPEMDSFWGHTLQSFSTATEAAAAAETFITSVPEVYVRNIPFSSGDALENFSQKLVTA